MSCEPSVLPLSATTTSPRTFKRLSVATALATQVPTVRASFRHGMTTVRVAPLWRPLWRPCVAPNGAAGGDKAAAAIPRGEVVVDRSAPHGKRGAVRREAAALARRPVAAEGAVDDSHRGA